MEHHLRPAGAREAAWSRLVTAARRGPDRGQDGTQQQGPGAGYGRCRAGRAAAG
jgi:hypothetical protein